MVFALAPEIWAEFCSSYGIYPKPSRHRSWPPGLWLGKQVTIGSR